MKDDKFMPIEKLMEFGMSMAVAQQMMQTMNNAMSQMKAPTVQVNMAVPKAVSFYALINEIPQGPFTESELMGHIMSGKVSKSTFVWLPGMPNWELASKLVEVNKLFLLVPPAPPIPNK